MKLTPQVFTRTASLSVRRNWALVVLGHRLPATSLEAGEGQGHRQS